MTTQSTINNLSSPSVTPEVIGATAPAGFPDEASIARMANAFFAAWPGAEHTPSGLNLDLLPPIVAPPHTPQPADPIAAFNHRGPNIAYEKSLNPDYPEHIPNYPDHPERRALASAPVIGGANLPQPPFEPHFPQLRDNVGPIPSRDADRITSKGNTPFYFLNEFDSPTTGTTASAPSDALAVQTTNLPEAAPTSAIPNDVQPNTIVTPNTKSTGSSAYYFLDIPSVAAQQPSTTSPHHFVSTTTQAFDVHQVRRDFPILAEQVNGRPLVWLDNAATTQKPQQVIDRIAYFYQHENSNIHRAAHELAARASDAYEHARDVVAGFIGAASAKDVIFVRGATEGINLIAKTWGVQNISAGDEIIVSHLEHHANIVPWYQLCQQTGAKLKVIPVDDTGQIKLESLPQLITDRTKLISITQVSNALGTVTPVAEVIQIAHASGIRVLVDGAQSVSHMPTNVRALDADFFVFSGHKVFGPTGIGAIYAKSELLESMPVWEGGGNMIEDVSFEQVIYQAAPNKFEAGTGNIAGAVGLAAALEYVESLGIHNIARYEHDLLEYAQHGLRSIPGLRLIGTALNKASVMSFTLNGFSTEQVGQALNRHGIAVRSGHHCAQPILRRFGVEKTVRPSLAFYNTTEEIDLLISVLHQLQRGQRSL